MIGLITGTVLKIRAPAPSWFRCLVAVRKYSAMVGQNGVFNIKSCQQLRNGTMPEYIESPHSKLHNLIWRKSPENVYICKKPWNDDVTRAMLEFIHHVHDTYPAVNIIVTEEVAGELLQDSGEGGIQLGDGDGDGAGFSSARSSGGGPLPLYTGSIEEIVGKTDMIVSLGGDGTILRAVSAFLNFSQVPPVLSFALGTLGFLLPFDFSKYMETFRMVYESRGKCCIEADWSVMWLERRR